MNQKKNTKKYLIFVLVWVAILAVTPFVRAEDDENDDEEEYASTSSNTSTADVAAKTVKQTIKDPDQIITTTETKTISLPDRDKDGVADDEDPHPDIPEIYIASDNNANGIVDSFENGN